MLTRRRVPIGTDNYEFDNNSSQNYEKSIRNNGSTERVRPDSAKEYTRTSGQDRTMEFISVIKYAQAKHPQYKSSSTRKQQVVTNEFLVISNKIGKDIACTFEKLESLHLIVSKKQDETSHEVANQLTDIIRQDLNMLNKQIAQLQQFLRHQTLNKQKMAHSNSVIVALQSKLALMSTEFKVILEVKQQNAKNLMSSNVPYQQVTAGYTAGEFASPSNSSRQTIDNNNHNYNNGNNTSTATPRSQRQNNPNYVASQQTYNHLSTTRYKQTQNDEGTHSQQDYYYNRSSYQPQENQMLRQRYVQEDRSKDEMVEMEQTIVELGGIFQQLATMVHEQGEMVQRIDSHIDDTQLNIDAAHTELAKYFRSVTSTRSFMLKVFAVLIIFIVFFMLFYL